MPGATDDPELEIPEQRQDKSQQTHLNHSMRQAMRHSEKIIDFANLDDSALLVIRAQMRAKLEHLAPHSIAHAELSARYDLSTQEIDDRARRAWSQAR